MTAPSDKTTRLLAFSGWTCAALIAGSVHVAAGIWLASAVVDQPLPFEDAGFMIVEFAELPAAPEASVAELPPAPEQSFQEAVDGDLSEELAESEELSANEEREVEPEPEAEPAEAPEEAPSLQTGSLPEVAAAEMAVPLPPHRPQGLAPPPVRREARREMQQKQAPRHASADSIAGAAPVAPAARAAAPQPGRDPSRADTLPASWQARLVAHLERHRRYPQAARASGRQGVVHLRFTIDQSGKVLAHGIARSSGAADLDDAAIAMVLRASPVPALPADAPANVSLTVPVRFEVR